MGYPFHNHNSKHYHLADLSSGLEVDRKGALDYVCILGQSEAHCLACVCKVRSISQTQRWILRLIDRTVELESEHGLWTMDNGQWG